MTTDKALHPTFASADHAVAEEPISYINNGDGAADASASAKQTNAATGLAPAALSLLGAALLAACGGGGGGGGANSNSAPGFNNFPTASTDNEAARFLLQGQLSASDADISAVRGGTFADYLQQQYDKPMGQTGWDWLESKGYGVSDKRRYFFNTYPADFMIWNQLFTSQDSLRKRVALALSEFFVASLQSAEFTWRSHAYAQYWDLLVQNAFGNYRQLLEDVTLSPAMGDFLNTKGNQKEDGKGRLPDENYGREVMQLFSIGLYQLNIDGTEKTGANGKKLESYSQDDVTNIARVFTGYDYDNAAGKNSVDVVKDDGSLENYKVDSRESVRRRMLVDPKKHSTLVASFLGATVPADPKGESGPAALKIALDTLFNHPNVGPFFGKQMIQRLVTSNPSPAYVARVASAFNNNGKGVRGDLRAVWTAVLLDDEARNPQNAADSNFGKLREPMLRFVQWGRSFGLSSAAGSWKLFETTGAADKLGQSPLRSPSVFNFFRPGFVPPSTALANTMSPAPEFQIVNETTVGGYLNYMQNVIRNGFDVPEANLPYQEYKVSTRDIVASYARELELVGDAAALVKRINLVMCAGQLSGPTQTIIINALNATPLPPSTATPDAVKNAKLDRISAAVLLTMASPEYLVQK